MPLFVPPEHRPLRCARLTLETIMLSCFMSDEQPNNTKNETLAVPRHGHIAVLGWGSLIWCPGSLLMKSAWRPDGPRLPIEFARISSDNRLTLVIHDGSADQPTYWVVSGCETREAACENLRIREGRPDREHIHYVGRNPAVSRGPENIINRVREWLTPREDIEAVIWTGLPSNWQKKRHCGFTPEDAVRFIDELEANRENAKATYERAREYITHAPDLVDTDVRQRLRQRGWQNATLSDNLFEAPLPLQPTTGDLKREDDAP